MEKPASNDSPFNAGWGSLLNGTEVSVMIAAVPPFYQQGRIAMPISFRANKVMLYKEGTMDKVDRIVPMENVLMITILEEETR